jgi:hypothetical protein
MKDPNKMLPSKPVNCELRTLYLISGERRLGRRGALKEGGSAADLTMYMVLSSPELEWV